MVLADQVDEETIEKALLGPYLVVGFPIRDAYQPGVAYLRTAKFEDVVPEDKILRRIRPGVDTGVEPESAQ